MLECAMHFAYNVNLAKFVFNNKQRMPTVWRYNGLRFFFYSMEGDEPPHIHVVKGDAEGKIWLTPHVDVSYLHGFTSAEEKAILSVLKEQKTYFKQKWDEYFKK